jgi:hypothetical protein
MISTSEVQQDRSKVAGGEPYEVQYFAKKHGITRDQAQRLIKRMGNNRKKLDEAAAKLKAAIVRRAERLLRLAALKLRAATEPPGQHRRLRIPHIASRPFQACDHASSNRIADRREDEWGASVGS